MGEFVPCRAVARAILGAVDAPDGVLLRCGRTEGHERPHRFLMEWGDPDPNPGGLIADQIAAYLANRRADPAFQQRIAERLAEDAEILRRLAAEDAEHAAPADQPHGRDGGAG